MNHINKLKIVMKVIETTRHTIHNDVYIEHEHGRNYI